MSDEKRSIYSILLGFREDSQYKQETALVVAAPVTSSTLETGLRLFYVEYTSSSGYRAYEIDGDRGFGNYSAVGEAYVGGTRLGEIRQHMSPGVRDEYHGQGIGTMLYFAGSFTEDALENAEDHEFLDEPTVVSTSTCAEYGGGRTDDAQKWWDKATERGSAWRGECPVAKPFEVSVEVKAGEVFEDTDIEKAFKDFEIEVRGFVEKLTADFLESEEYEECLAYHRGDRVGMEDCVGAPVWDGVKGEAYRLLKSSSEDYDLQLENFRIQDITSRTRADRDEDWKATITAEFHAQVDKESMEYEHSDKLDAVLEKKYGLESLDEVSVSNVLDTAGSNISAVDYRVALSVRPNRKKPQRPRVSVSWEEAGTIDPDVEVEGFFAGMAQLDHLHGVAEMESAELLFAMSANMRKNFEKYEIELPDVVPPERYAFLDFDANPPYIVGMIAGLNGIDYAQQALAAILAIRDSFAQELFKEGAELSSEEPWPRDSRVGNPAPRRGVMRRLDRNDFDLMDLADID